MKIEKEDFELWRSNPVTEAVTHALVKIAEQNKQQWMEISWIGGKVDPIELATLRASAEMAKELSELTFEELEEKLNEE